jgi:filamentous hemagglutinin family protein
MAGFSLRRFRRVSQPYAAFLASVAIIIAPLTVHAGPTGAQVIHGNVVFSQNGNIFVIHAGHKSIINYSSFNIGKNETVQFIQPNELARVLNRITGPGPTQIDGKLLANGIVYLVNPAGVMFGKDSVVDVGGIYAAAADLSNNRFLNGVNRFKNASGSVVNEGSIEGDFVHLIGQHVANHGLIVADEGIVTMLAGQDVLIGKQGGRLMVRIDGTTITKDGKPVAGQTDPSIQSTPGVENTGEIIADNGRVVVGAGDLYSLAVRNTGKIRAKAGEITVAALDGAIHNEGLFDAGIDRGQAGSITVRGPSVVNAGEISADVRRGRAGYVEVTSHNHTLLLDGSTISAAGGSGRAHGGEVLIHSYDGITRFSRGALVDVSAGRLGGHGGFAEVSGKTLGFAGEVNLKSRNGYRKGHLLIDPLDIYIVDGPGTGDVLLSPADGDVLFADLAGVSITIWDEVLEAILGDITLQADRDILVNATVDLVHNNNVTFIANRNIAFNSPINGAHNFLLSADADFNGIGRLVFNVPLTFSGFGKFSGAEILVGGDLAGLDDLSFSGPVRLTNNVTLSGQDITFLDTVDSQGPARSLTLNSSGNGITTFVGDVGASSPLASVTTNADGQTHIGGNVSTKTGMSFADDVLLTAVGNQILDANTGMLQAKSLTKATGDLDLFGSLIVVTGDAIVTAGALRFHDAAELGGNVFAGSNLTFDGDVILTGAALQILTAQTGTLWAKGELTKAVGDLNVLGLTAVNFDDVVDVTAGNLDITGVLTAQDLINAGGSISINDDATIAGDVTAGQNITFFGSATIGNLLAGTGNVIATNGFVDFKGATTVGGDVTAGTNIDFEDALSTAIVGGTVNGIGGDVTFAGGADVGGDVIAGGSAVFGGDADIFSDVLAQGGDASFAGNATIGGSVEASNNVQFTSALATAMIGGHVLATTGNILFAGNATVATDVTANAGTIDFDGLVDIGGNVIGQLTVSFNDAGSTALVDGNVQSLAGSVIFEGGADIGGFVAGHQNIFFNNAAALADIDGAVLATLGDVTFAGGADVGGNVEAGGDVSFTNAGQTALIGGNVIANGGSVTFMGNADVDGDVNANQNITFNGNALIGSLAGTGNVTATLGFVDFNGLADVLGNVNAGTFVSFDDALSTAIVGGNVDALGGNVSFAGGANVGGSVTASDSVLFNNAALAALIGGNVLAISGSALFNGDADVNGDVTAGQNITFNGAATIGDLLAGTGNVNAILGFADFNGLASVGGNVTAGSTVTFDDAANVAVIGGNVQSVNDSVMFAGGADVGGNVLANQDVQFNGAALDAIIAGNVTATLGDALFAGNANVGGTVHAGNDVSFANALATALINGDVIADAGSVLFNGIADVGGNVEAGQDATFNNVATVDGNVIANAGNALFATFASLGGNVTAGGNINFNDAVTFFGSATQIVDAGGQLLALSTLTKTGAGELILGGAAGVIVNGAITNSVGGLIVNDDMLFGGGVVTTQGDQTYNGALLLSNHTTLDANASDIFLNGDINGVANLGFNLTIFAGQATFGDSAADQIGTAVGGALGTLDVFADAIVNAGIITTKFDQLFNQSVLVAGASTLNSLNGGDVHFFDVITGNSGALTINTAGDTIFDDTVALASLHTLGGGITQINGISIITSGDQHYQDDVVLGNSVGLTAANVLFDGNVNSAANEGHELSIVGNAVLGNAATDNVGGDIGGELGSLDITGNTTLFAATINTLGHQTYDGQVALVSGSTLTSFNDGRISFYDTVSGAGNLSVDTAGDTTFNGAVNIGALHTFGGGITHINGGSVTTANAQLYEDDVHIAGGSTFLTSTADQEIHFFATVQGSSRVTIQTAGDTVFDSTVELLSLTTNGGGLTLINGGSVITEEGQTYDDDVVIGADAVLAGELVTFNGNLNSAGGTAFDLIIAGDAVFGDDAADSVGNIDALGQLKVMQDTTINAGQITTTFDQNFQGNVTLNSDATLASTGNGDIHFHDSLNGNGTLIANTGGDTIFDGNVDIAALTTDAAGRTIIDANQIRTSGDQFFGDDVLLTSATTLIGHSITFNDRLDSNNNAELTINAESLFLNGRVGKNGALGLLKTTGSGTAFINTDQIFADVIRFNTAVELLTSTKLTATDLVRLEAIAGNGFDLSIKSPTTKILENPVGLNALIIRGATTFANELTATSLIDIQATSQIKSSADLNYDADLIVFNTPKLAAPGDINLNVATPTTTIDEFATIVAKRDMVINAGGDFAMGANERFTGLRSLSIQAMNATLGDLTTGGDMEVDVIDGNGNSGDIIIQRRDKAIVNGTEDLGTDFVSGGEINFLFGGAENLKFVGGGQGATFAPFEGVAGASKILQELSIDSTLQLSFLDLGNAVRQESGFETIDPFLKNAAGDVLDLRGTGPSSTDISDSLAGVLPEETTSKIVQPRASLSSAQRSLLVELGVEVRDWPGTERQLARQVEEESRLTGRYVFEDVSTLRVVSTDREVAEPRLSQAIAEELYTLRKQYMYDEATKTWRDREMKEMLATVYRDYLATAQQAGQQPDKVAFREYVNSLPQDNQTLLLVQNVRQMLEQFDLLGLNSSETKRPRQSLIQLISPEGSDREFVEELVRPDVRIGALR